MRLSTHTGFRLQRFLLIGICLCLPHQGAAQELILRHINIVDVVNGVVVPDQRVEIRAGRFSDISSDSNTVPVQPAEIDGADTYLMPGLIDAHVHVHDEDDLSLFLARGITTVRILDGIGADLRRRDRTQPQDFRARSVVCKQIDSIRSAAAAPSVVTDARDDGYTCLKLYSPPPWDLDKYRALAMAAHADNFRLEGHLPRNLSLEQLFDGPAQDSVAHLEEFLYTWFYRPEIRNNGADDNSSILAATKLISNGNPFVVTTLAQYRNIGLVAVGATDQLRVTGDLELMPSGVRREWSGDNNVYRKNITPAQGQVILDNLAPRLGRLAVALDGAGVRLVAGTDSSRNIPFSAPGLSYQRELLALHDAGLDNTAILRAATVNAAALLQREDLGRVAVGMIADGLVVGADPLDDITTLFEIHMVLKDGYVFTAQEIDRELRRIIDSRR